MLLGQADYGPALLVFFSFSGPGWFWPNHVFMGQTDSGPSLLSAPSLAQKKIGDFVGPRSAQSLLGRKRPNPFGLESGPVSGSARPSPPSIIYYILHCFLYYLYIQIYEKKI
jgi:hypothetical protein